MLKSSSMATCAHDEDKHPFVECVTLADEIKRAASPCWGGYQSQWHFVNIPYLDDPGSKLSDFDWTPPTHNSTEAVNAIVSWYNTGRTGSPITSDILKYSGNNS